MHDLIEHLPAVIYEYAIHPDGKRFFSYVSPASERILGLKAEDILKDSSMMDSIIHEDDLSDLQESSLVSEENAVEWNWQGRMRIHGKVKWVEIRSNGMERDDGGILRSGIIQDITERKETAQESQLRYQALEKRSKKSKTLFTQFFQNVPIATVMLDEFGKVKEINKGFKETFGYELNELKGKNLNDHIVPEELRTEGIDLNNLITSNQTISVETIRRHKHGKPVNVIVYGMPVILDNRTIGIFGAYVDITDRKKVEEELKIRNTELDNFVYKVSHDLRAPLSSVLGLVNLAKLPGNYDNPMDYINIIGQKVELLDHFIGDVLSHSKNLKMEVSTSKVNLQQIIDRTLTDLSYLEGAKDLNKIIKIEGIDFYSDPWRIAEIFRNLISNAIKYRHLNNGPSEIVIKIQVDNLRADISFADSGIGIEEANLTRVFEMFYRATEQSDGSGIGLYIVKNAVDKLGGQISVASRVGHGTRFNIILPNRINRAIDKSADREV